MKANGGETVAVYAKKYPFCAEEDSGLTLLEAERAFQLLPDPPKVETLNDYIVMAINGDENGFSFFLHAYEERLNRRIRGFLLREGFRNTEPDRLFDYRVFGIPSRIACSIISWPACVPCWKFCQTMIPTAVRAF